MLIYGPAVIIQTTPCLEVFSTHRQVDRSIKFESVGISSRPSTYDRLLTTLVRHSGPYVSS